MPYIATILQEYIGKYPTLLIPHEPSHHNVTVPDIRSRCVLCLLSIGLLEFRTIDALQIDRFIAAVVTNSQSIALMDGHHSCNIVSP